MENKYQYFKRDISWLSFNYRVLLEADDDRLPLYERINFISIYSSNLEEFYKIRVADHKAVASGVTDGTEESLQSAKDLLEEDYNNACIDSVYRHIDYMLNLLGNDDHVGFGSDFDGISHPPYNIHGVQDYKPLIEYLQSKNYSDSTIEKITHKNVLNLLSKVL